MSDFRITSLTTAARGLDQATSAASIRNLRADASNKEKTKIEKAGRDFESILIGQWLEQAEKSFATVPGEDPDKKDQDAGQDQMRSIAFHALADGLARSGGFGIAAMISRHLEAAQGQPELAKVDTKLKKLQ